VNPTTACVAVSDSMKNICEQKDKDDLLGWHSIVGAIDPLKNIY
jgi:hypothetical protein